MKTRVIEFVEAKGSASYTEIIKFVYEQNYGQGTYNKNRGYYSGAFVPGKGCFITGGKEQIIKQPNGKYIVK